VTIIIELKIR